MKLTLLRLLIFQLLPVTSLRAPLAITPLKRSLDRHIKMQRILSFAEQLHNWFVHQLVQADQSHVQIQMRRLGAVHKQRNAIARKVQRQRANGRRFVDAQHRKVLGMRDGVGGNVERDLSLFAVQEEGELVLERRKVDHEQRLDGDLELATRPKCRLINTIFHITHL